MIKLNYVLEGPYLRRRVGLAVQRRRNKNNAEAYWGEYIKRAWTESCGRIPVFGYAKESDIDAARVSNALKPQSGG